MFVHVSVGLYITKQLALRLVVVRRHGETAAHARVRQGTAGGKVTRVAVRQAPGSQEQELHLEKPIFTSLAPYQGCG